MKAFVSWSGGKETLLACYKAMRYEDVTVGYCLNMISEDGERSRSHGVTSQLLRMQAEAIEIPIVQRKASWETYEEQFKQCIADLKRENISTGVFGDIDFQIHRDWVERVCGESGVKPLFPLWNETRKNILSDFLRCGFEAVVVATKADCLGQEWIGRKVDNDFVRELTLLGNIDLCGENGEYHTFVIDGPIFKRRVEITPKGIVKKGDHWFLEI